jgi:hypothetical protein
MAKSTIGLTKRSVNRKRRVKRQYDKCQYWDMKEGGCASNGVSTFKYTYGGERYSPWLCARHYDKKRRQIFGTCSYDEWISDKHINCKSLRATNTRGESRKLKGYCRRHERSYLEIAGDVAMSETLDRMAEKITVNTETGCWDLEPYGSAQRPMRSAGGRKWLTYRLTYVWFYGGHDNGLELSHDCDNSACCNPVHVTPIRPRQNRDAEHDSALAVFWAMTAATKPPPPKLQAWADTHDLPLHGTKTAKIAESFFPSKKELNAQYGADLAADEQEDTAALAS